MRRFLVDFVLMVEAGILETAANQDEDLAPSGALLNPKAEFLVEPVPRTDQETMSEAVGIREAESC